MKKVVLGTLLIALAGSTAAFAQGGAATEQLLVPLAAQPSAARPAQLWAQLPAQPPGESLMSRGQIPYLCDGSAAHLVSLSKRYPRGRGSAFQRRDLL